jgi:uncharacterized phage protein (TIGR02216 family)
MANRIRGAVPLDLGGRRYTLCLTLGALAELEDLLGAGDLADLAARFMAGRLSARDLIALLGVALRGGGHDLDDAAVAQLPLAGELEAVTTALGAVLAAAFGEAPDPANPPQRPSRSSRGTGHDSGAPTPWAEATDPLSRAGEGWGEGREGSGPSTPSTLVQAAPYPGRSHPSPDPSPARERGPAPYAGKRARPSAESASEAGPEHPFPTPLPTAFPWDDALALGLGVLGWHPGDFWSATPREFAAALGRRARPEPLSRSG